jgi:phosphoribosylformylglycinamidine synthase
LVELLNPHSVAFAGSAAHSAFRLSRLQQQIAGDHTSLDLHSRFVYLVSLSEAPTPERIDRLQALLNADAVIDCLADLSWPEAKVELGNEAAACDRLVIPHHGTLSPWASKATEILRRCGLDSVVRVERATAYRLYSTDSVPDSALEVLHDRMTQDVVHTLDEAWGDRLEGQYRPLNVIELGDDPLRTMAEVNQNLGLALSEDEIEYLVAAYRDLERNPSDAELMMFAQANSEHCRHKIFRGSWVIDGEAQSLSLFDMIRETHRCTPDGVLSAYSDNAAVFSGGNGFRWQADVQSGVYEHVDTEVHVQIKAETHNHPTAISPFPGAATGSGGEIRDEAATGRGARPKLALSGFSVSELHLPELARPWETDTHRPGHLATSLQIMIEGPIGAAAYNNEFGRPALTGYFRTLTQNSFGQTWGYHKPIMLAGGLGNIAPEQVLKHEVPVGAKVVVLGGPAMLIGLGGGAASSAQSGASNSELDYASVQRENPEMERRCQQVIEFCIAQGDANPIISIHDVGAGGLSNAIPEILDADQRGGLIDLRSLPTADSRLSPMELWCNEAQERYVLAIRAEAVDSLLAACQRERCPVAVVGEATADGHFLLQDPAHADSQAPVDLPMEVLLGKTPQMHRDVNRWQRQAAEHESNHADLSELLNESIDRVLRLPAVGSKQFLITIGDRSIGGLTVRDQMVGPWQVPVADVAVSARDFHGYQGEAMAMGERAPVAIYDAPASGRMAIAEALTNLAAAPIDDIRRVKLSANWMAAAGEKGQDADLYDTVKAIGMELCPQLGLGIPVGKDSLSMRAKWQHEGEEQQVSAPVSLIVSAFAPVEDIRRCLTPELDIQEESTLLLIDLGAGQQRLGASAWAQVWQQDGGAVADVHDAAQLKAFFDSVQALNRAGHLLAYHDRSDGGLLVSLLEMAWAGRCGLDVTLTDDEDAIAALFNEELGAVIQVRNADIPAVRQCLSDAGLAHCVHEVARPAAHGDLLLKQGARTLIKRELAQLQQVWSETSRSIAGLRDNAHCVDEEYDRLNDWQAPGLKPELSFELKAPAVHSARPQVAILREQGVNGHMEMAAAFHQAGFTAVDVHMSDLLSGRFTLDQFQGLAACGGFSYGDVLGAGQGWAKSILFNNALRDQFEAFFQHPDRFALGVCNGCQMMSTLAPLIPGAENWPRFMRNRSEQFEARLSLVEVMESPSIFLQGMQGSRIPVAVAHGEGRAEFHRGALDQQQHCLRYVENDGSVAGRYPANPNGSPDGITGLCNRDGRVTIMMPHPERLLRAMNFSWAPTHWGEHSPWQQMFNNARGWLA